MSMLSLDFNMFNCEQTKFRTSAIRNIFNNLAHN